MKYQFFIEYGNGDSLELRGGNLSTAIATFGGRYANRVCKSSARVLDYSDKTDDKSAYLI